MTNDKPGPSLGKIPFGRLPADRQTGPASTITQAEIRDILRPHRDGGPISRLYATGEITSDTIPALGVLAASLEDSGHQPQADRVDDVIRYARDAGERPPIPRWTASHGQEQP